MALRITVSYIGRRQHPLRRIRLRRPAKATVHPDEALLEAVARDRRLSTVPTGERLGEGWAVLWLALDSHGNGSSGTGDAASLDTGLPLS